jgi:diguanylate cyclase (GGDEF)-like protein/PAS domain S-box-containing protein
MFDRVGHRLLAVVGAVVTAGLVVLLVFFAQRQEAGILAQNERTLVKVTESVTQALRTVMLAGYADIGQEFGDHLKHVADVADLRILRADGTEAFRDNQTLAKVNAALGVDRFQPRAQAQTVQVLPADAPSLRQAVASGEIVRYYETVGSDRRLTILAPITSQEACHTCHSEAAEVRGVLKLTTSLAGVEAEVRAGRIKAVAMILITVVVIMLVVDIAVRRTVVRPLSEMTKAMGRAAAGDLSHQIPAPSEDELGRMAVSFNVMIGELTRMYGGLKLERNKLSTILLGSRDGIVVTDGQERVVLVNPAAEALLGKPARQIIGGGLLKLFDDPDWARARLAVPAGEQRPEDIGYKRRTLSVYMASITADSGERIGSAALIRDVTEAKRMRQELERLSVTDALTGLYNRRYFDQKLKDEFALARRYNGPMAVLLFDVDHFKRFNDTYGHDQGDRVLQAIAGVMKSLRTIDITCRYGGEEFVVILPNTPVDNAVYAAERLRAAVAAMVVDGLTVTISIGVAALPGVAVDTPDDLVKAADTALYASKQAGRNKVTRA